MFGSESPCDVETLNQAFIDAAQYMNPVIADKTKKYNSLYRSKIERGTFTYGEGYVKMSHTFYGGTAVQDCGASWSAVEASRPAGTNGPDDPVTTPVGMSPRSSTTASRRSSTRCTRPVAGRSTSA